MRGDREQGGGAGPEQFLIQRPVDAEPAAVDRRVDHRLGVRVGPPPVPHQLTGAGQRLGEADVGVRQRRAYPGVDRRDADGALAFGLAEPIRYVDRLAGEGEQVPGRAVDVGDVRTSRQPSPGRCGQGRKVLRPHRAEDDRAVPVDEGQQLAPGQPGSALGQVSLDVVQPENRPPGKVRQLVHAVRRVDGHQPPTGQHREGRLVRAAGLSRRGGADQQHETADARRLGQPSAEYGIVVARHVPGQPGAAAPAFAGTVCGDRRVDAEPRGRPSPQLAHCRTVGGSRRASFQKPRRPPIATFHRAA